MIYRTIHFQSTIICRVNFHPRLIKFDGFGTSQNGMKFFRIVIVTESLPILFVTNRSQVCAVVITKATKFLDSLSVFIQFIIRSQTKRILRFFHSTGQNKIGLQALCRFDIIPRWNVFRWVVRRAITHRIHGVKVIFIHQITEIWDVQVL